MARTTRRKYYKRKTARWAPNIAKIRDSISATTGEFGANSTLAFNPAQSTGSVSQTYTAKNFDITFTIEASSTDSANYIEGITVYIMYVPQGMTVGNDYYQLHPEYILNYKYLGSPQGKSESATTTGGQESQQFQPVRVRTRMARKLQTGDQIILYVNGTNTSSDSQTLLIDGLVRWWTKAN